MSKNILIIEPSTSGLEVLKTAYQMGLNIFVFSADQDERIIPDLYKKYIRCLIIVDTNCFRSLTKECQVLHKKNTLSAVIPGFEIYVEYAARLAHMINLPGISLATCECFRNKYRMRTGLKQAGINTPRHYLVTNISDLNKAALYVEFPCVIKPIDQSGSVHVSKVENIDEMKEAYHNMCKDTWTEMGKGVGTTALVEEYIQGVEYSVEGFVDSNGTQIVSITEKMVKGTPYFVEMGHIVEAPIDITIKHTIHCYIKKIISVLQMNAGVFHAEIKLENGQPMLIEIAGRLAGDKICDLILKALGVNLYQIMIQVHLGDTINLEIKSRDVAGIRYLAPAAEIRKYTKINGIDMVSMLPGFKDFKILINPGQTVHPLQNFMGRAAYIIFKATTYEQLRNNLDLAECLITFT